MATAFEKYQPDGDVMDLEPTGAFDLGGNPIEANHGPVGLILGSGASLSTETRSLRRTRLGYAAVILAIVYGIFLVWIVATRIDRIGVVWPSFAVRLLIAGAVAGLALGRIELSGGKVDLLEAVLFGGFTLTLCVSQYVVNLEHIRHGDLLGSVAHSKNGVIQLFLLTVLYGMVMPNNAQRTAGAVLTMALALITSFVLLIGHPAVAPIAEVIGRAEPLGTDLLFILVIAGLAIYGSHLVNGLRTELHGAKQFGQYKLGKKLGAGGMGEVFLAEHQMLKRPCAIKLIRSETNTNPLALARFEREVQSAARLAHPNTVEIFDYGHTDDGTFYYVMEYLVGLSLEDLVKQYGPLSPGRLIYLLRQVCAGLCEAHTLGLIHRDLKPANIHIALRGGESDIAKVLDFGLVKITQDPNAPQLTADQTVSGTPFYMSPEQAQGRSDVDNRCDIYALGAIAYFALTGRPPFVGDSAMSVMIAHARDPVVPPSQIRAEIPQDLEQVVLRCLSKSLDDRFADVKSLSKALAACDAAADWSAEQADQWWLDAAQAATTQS